MAFFHAEVTAKERSAVDASKQLQVQETYGKLPLYFIQNNGQMDEKVKFYEKGSGRTTFFAKDGVYLLLGSSKQTADNSKKSAVKPEIVANKVKPSLANIPS
ncbi:MAG: hypothetical protein PH343_04580, partial [Nitrospira sp.]|nr:hypothetical protein [Nitrospira sp.]